MDLLWALTVVYCSYYLASRVGFYLLFLDNTREEVTEGDRHVLGLLFVPIAGDIFFFAGLFGLLGEYGDDDP